MKAALDRVWKNAKWAVWLLIAVGAGLLVLFLGPFFKKERREGEPEEPLPTLPPVIQERLDTAHEEAATAKATARATSEAQKQALNQISTIDDGRERRRRLAELLRTL